MVKRRRLGQRGGGRGDGVRSGDGRRRGGVGGEVARRPATARDAAGGAPTADGVTWLHAAVAPDGRRSFRLDDAPDPAAIRQAARRRGPPIDRITEVEVIAP
jgi:hypothetical protein